MGIVEDFNAHRSKPCSLVLLWGDCVQYHIEKFRRLRFPKEETNEALRLVTLVGAIAIPPLQLAFEFREELENV